MSYASRQLPERSQFLKLSLPTLEMLQLVGLLLHQLLKMLVVSSNLSSQLLSFGNISNTCSTPEMLTTLIEHRLPRDRHERNTPIAVANSKLDIISRGTIGEARVHFCNAGQVAFEN